MTILTFKKKNCYITKNYDEYFLISNKQKKLSDYLLSHPKLLCQFDFELFEKRKLLTEQSKLFLLTYLILGEF